MNECDVSQAKDIAVLQTQMESVMEGLSALKATGDARDAKRSEDMRRILGEFDALRSTLAKQQGFLNGAAFVIRAFWAAVGASVLAFLGWLVNGAPPLK